MKKFFITLALGFVCIIGITGCSTTTNSSDAGSMNLYPQTVGPTDNYRPQYSVDTQNKVSGEAKVNVLFGIFAWSDKDGVADNSSIFSSSSILSWIFAFIPNKKNMAAQRAFYDACKNASCDTIVAARYEIVEKNYFFIFSTCNVEVKGFPATLDSVEVVKPLQYYVDANGNIHTLDRFVNPIKLFDVRSGGGDLFKKLPFSLPF